MSNASLVKDYFMEEVEAQLPEKIESSVIEWQSGKNVTMQKISVKKKKKKHQKVQKEIETNSFFHFFSSHVNPDEEPYDTEGEEAIARLEDDWAIAMSIKEDMVPLALEYYLGIAENRAEDELP